MSELHNKSSASIFNKYAKPTCNPSRMNQWAEMLMGGASAAEMLLEFPPTDVWASDLRRKSKGAKSYTYTGQSLVCSGSALIWVSPTWTSTHAIFSRRHKKLIISPVTFYPTATGLTPLVANLIAYGSLPPPPSAWYELNQLEFIVSSISFRRAYDRFDAAALQPTLSMDLMLNIDRGSMMKAYGDTYSILSSIWVGSEPYRQHHGWPYPREDDPDYREYLRTDQFLVKGLKLYGKETIDRMIQMAEQYGYPEDALGKALHHMSKFQSY